LVELLLENNADQTANNIFNQLLDQPPEHSFTQLLLPLLEPTLQLFDKPSS